MGDFIVQIGGAADPVHPALGVLAGASLKAAVLLTGALALTLVLRRASAATRHLVWSAAIGAALLLPAAGAVLPDWPVSVPGLDAGVALAGDDLAATPTASQATDGAYAGVRSAGVGERSAAHAHGGRGAATDSDRAGSSEIGVATGESTSTASVSGAGTAVRSADAGNSGHTASAHGTAMDAEASVGAASTRSATVSTRDRSAGSASAGSRSDSSVAPSWGMIALLVWAFGATVVAAGIVVGLVRVRRLARRARPATDGRVHARVAELSARLGLQEAPTVLRGDVSAMPMTWGVANAVVFLPSEADEWSDERLDAVLLHELAHVRRRDYPVQLAADLACAVYWFNPLAWLAARRLRVEREHACDDQVLFAGARPSTYAGELLEIARSLRPARATAFAAMSMARPSQLTGRLLAVLDEDRPRRIVSRRLAASIAVAAAVLFVPLAALTPAARAETAQDDESAVPGVDVIQPASPSATDAAPTPEPASTAALLDEPAGDLPDPTTDLGGSPAADLRPCWERDPRRVGTQRDSEDEVDTITWTTGGCELEARIEGDVRFRGDLMDVVRIAPGGMLRLTEEKGGDRRRVDVRPGPDGRLVHESFVDGDRRPFDAEAREWFGQGLEALLHWTGYAAGDRVAWVLAREGVDGVLEDIDRVRTDFIRQRYMEELRKRVGTDTAPPPRMPPSAAAVAGSVGTALDPCWERNPESVSIRRNSDDDHETIEWRADDCEIEARVEGTVHFRGDFRGIASISPGGWFRLEEDDGDVRRRLEIRPGAGGELEYEWSVDGDRHPFDADARAWYERTLTALLRRTGYAVEDRVAWLLDRGGVDAVLADVETVTSDFVQARYLREMLEQADPDVGELVRVVALAGIRLDSDFELARLLTRVAEERPLTDEMRSAFIETSRMIDSDFERARVLKTALEGDRLGEADISALIGAAEEIDSDFELARLLMAVGETYTLGPDVQRAYLRAARSIGSDFEQRRVFDALLEQDGLEPDIVAGIVDASSEIGSDFELSQLLQASASFDLSSPTVRRAYFAAARSIDSDFELRRVLSRLIENQQADDDLVREVLVASQSIDSDFELASLLVEVAERHRLEGELREMYVRAVESIGSTHELGRAYGALMAQEREGT